VAPTTDAMHQAQCRLDWQMLQGCCAGGVFPSGDWLQCLARQYKAAAPAQSLHVAVCATSLQPTTASISRRKWPGGQVRSPPPSTHSAHKHCAVHHHIAASCKFTVKVSSNAPCWMARSAACRVPLQQVSVRQADRQAGRQTDRQTRPLVAPTVPPPHQPHLRQQVLQAGNGRGTATPSAGGGASSRAR
jgi:hypothetical protein